MKKVAKSITIPGAGFEAIQFMVSEFFGQDLLKDTQS